MKIIGFVTTLALLVIGCAESPRGTTLPTSLPTSPGGEVRPVESSGASAASSGAPKSAAEAGSTSSTMVAPEECQQDYVMRRDDGPFTYADDGTWERAELYGRPVSTRTASVVLFGKGDDRAFTFGALRIDFRNSATDREAALMHWVRDDFMKSSDHYIVSQAQDVPDSSGAARYFTFEERAKPRPKVKKRRGRSAERPLPLQYGLVYVRRLSDDPHETATLLVRAYWRHTTDKADAEMRERYFVLAESVRRGSSVIPPLKAP